MRRRHARDGDRHARWTVDEPDRSSVATRTGLPHDAAGKAVDSHDDHRVLQWSVCGDVDFDRGWLVSGENGRVDAGGIEQPDANDLRLAASPAAALFAFDALGLMTVALVGRDHLGRRPRPPTDLECPE